MIDGLQDLLERIEPWESIVSIIPGEIRPARGSDSGIHLHVKYPTQSGIKVLAKSTTAVQEVFFVSKQPDELIRLLNKLG